MYKKITVALCIVISLFFIVPLLYFWWTMDAGSPAPYTIKGPFISISLRNLTSRNHSSILLHDTVDSDYIFDRSIWDWDSENDLTSSNYHQYTKSLILECHANTPVKWEYEGDGVLVSNVKHASKREIKSFEDNTTYWFTTSIEFLSISEQISGKYACRSFESQSQAYFYIYVKGFKTFITKEHVEKEIEPDEKIFVSCPISNPLKSGSIILRQVLQLLSTNVYNIVDPTSIINYDPKVGFQLLPNSWGLYQCVDLDESNETSGIIKIFKPKRLVVKGEYFTTIFTNNQLNSSERYVICESVDNVTLKFINFLPFKRPVHHFFNQSSKFHSARFLFDFRWLKDYSAIECVSLKDQRVIRVWKLLKNESSDKTTFKFDSFRKGFACCTSSPTAVPQLTQASCYSQTECELKKSCVKLEKKCPHELIPNQYIFEGGPGCAVAKVEDVPSGVLECSFMNVTKTYLYFYNKKANFHNYTSSDFRRKKVPYSKILKISQGEYMEREEMVLFNCQGPRLFFSSGFQWALKTTRTGKIEYLINESKEVEESVSEIKEFIKVPLHKLDSSRTIVCLAPLTTSFEWVNATVKYRRSFSSSTTPVYDREEDG